MFTAGGDEFPIKATTLSVEADWASAVESAAREGQGFAPVRGFKRLQTRFFGSEIVPPVQAYDAALDYKLAELARKIDQRHVEATLVRRGLSVEVVPGQAGRRLAQDLAAARVVRSLARLERGQPIALPVLLDPVEVTAAELAPAAAQARIALSAPVRLEYEGTRWKLPRWRIAELLSLPVGGATEIAIAGPGAEAWFKRLRKTVERAPVDAAFVVEPGGIHIAPDKPGLSIDVPATAKALLTAATSPGVRTAQLSVRTAAAERSTADAQAMGITGVVGSYYTTYGGIPSRLHNVALVAQLIDGALIAPGKTFSFNGTTGERTAEKGFEEAPVIINGELQTGLGGGICQVSTTVFNAVYEAGLQIDERTNHALYISHYPLGRDATVNYPDLDLKFTNDTDHWLLLRTFVGTGSLTVNLYGTPQDRRVETTAQPLRVVGAPHDQAGAGPDAREGHGRGRRVRPAGALDERQQEGLRRRWHGAARGHLVLLLPLGAEGRPCRHEAEAEARSRSRRSSRRRSIRPIPARRTASRTRRRRLLRLSRSDRLGEPGGHARRPPRDRVHRGVRRGALGDELPGALDRVLVAEARPAQVDAACPDPEPVVEVRRAEIPDVDRGRQRLDPLRLDRQIAAGVLREIGDARHLQPDDEGRMVCDPLGVRLGEADDDLGREPEALHCWRKISIRGSGC